MLFLGIISILAAIWRCKCAGPNTHDFVVKFAKTVGNVIGGFRFHQQAQWLIDLMASLLGAWLSIVLKHAALVKISLQVDISGVCLGVHLIFDAISVL